MKIKSNFVLEYADNGEPYVLDSENKKNVNVNLTNEQAVFIFKYLSEHDSNKEKLLLSVLDEFDISTVLALNYIDITLKELKEKDILE